MQKFKISWIKLIQNKHIMNQFRILRQNIWTTLFSLIDDWAGGKKRFWV